MPEKGNTYPDQELIALFAPLVTDYFNSSLLNPRPPRSRRDRGGDSQTVSAAEKHVQAREALVTTIAERLLVVPATERPAVLEQSLGAITAIQVQNFSACLWTVDERYKLRVDASLKALELSEQRTAAPSLSPAKVA